MRVSCTCLNSRASGFAKSGDDRFWGTGLFCLFSTLAVVSGPPQPASQWLLYQPTPLISFHAVDWWQE